MKNIIFLGAPGSGKGTHTNMLMEQYGYITISTGDLLRAIVLEDSELGRKIKNIMATGELVSDDIMLELIEGKLESIEGKPFILDGFPRNLAQAKILSTLLETKNIDYQAIYLDILEQTCKERIVGRLTCKCGKPYNIFAADLRPKKEGICDVCGSTLIKRDDDNEESFKKRYEVFIKNTEPIKEYYKQLGKLVVIDANQTESRNRDDIHKDIIGVIND